MSESKWASVSDWVCETLHLSTKILIHSKSTTTATTTTKVKGLSSVIWVCACVKALESRLSRENRCLSSRKYRENGQEKMSACNRGEKRLRGRERKQQKKNRSTVLFIKHRHRRQHTLRRNLHVVIFYNVIINKKKTEKETKTETPKSVWVNKAANGAWRAKNERTDDEIFRWENVYREFIYFRIFWCCHCCCCYWCCCCCSSRCRRGCGMFNFFFLRFRRTFSCRFDLSHSSHFSFCSIEIVTHRRRRRLFHNFRVSVIRNATCVRVYVCACDFVYVREWWWRISERLGIWEFIYLLFFFVFGSKFMVTLAHRHHDCRR